MTSMVCELEFQFPLELGYFFTDKELDLSRDFTRYTL